MKKALLILSMVVSCLIVSAQEHLSFMDIPLDLTRTEFEQQMQNVGFTPDDETNEQSLPLGGEFFDGTFYGHEAIAIVNFNVNTELVYGASVLMEEEDLEAAQSHYQEMKDLLDEKYLIDKYDTNHQESKKNGFYYYNLVIVPKDGDAFSSGIGVIQLEITTQGESIVLSLTFQDWINSKKN